MPKKKREFFCQSCNKSFANREAFAQHHKNRHGGGQEDRPERKPESRQRQHEIEAPQGEVTQKTNKILCTYCGALFSRHDNLSRHIKRLHQYVSFRSKCQLCFRVYENAERFKAHVLICGATSKFKLRKTAMAGRLMSYGKRVPRDRGSDFDTMMAKEMSHIRRLIVIMTRRHGSISFSLIVNGLFEKLASSELVATDYIELPLRTARSESINGRMPITELNEIIARQFSQVMARLDELTVRGSG